jgi:serine phosphatase RsbU (regulator of sigma subunit)
MYRPCEQVGGDWYGVFYHPKIKRINIYIADVSGHGLSSAFLANLVSGAVQSDEMSTSNSSHNEVVRVRFAQLATQLNQLVASGSGNRKNMTMCMASLHIETGVLTILSAGHPALLRLNGNTSRANMLPVKQNNFLGCAWDKEFESTEIQLMAGDSILFYTDGLTESRAKAPAGANSSDQHPKLGSKSLLKLVTELAGEKELVEAIAEKVTRERVIEDDLAILMLKWH